MLHHAYIIFGNREEANILARETLLRHNIEIERNPNVLSLEVETFNIDDARSLKEWAFGTPFGAGKKVAFIRAHALAQEAQHALLKILEEPPASTVFIFMVPHTAHILRTVLSRVLLLKGAKDEGLGAGNNAEQTRKVMETDAQKFLASPLKDRFLMATALADSENPRDVNNFFDALESELAVRLKKTPQKTAPALAALYLARRYAGDRGASKKMLLEMVAVSF